MSAGELAGICVGAILGLALILCAAVAGVCQSRRRRGIKRMAKIDAPEDTTADEARGDVVDAGGEAAVHGHADQPQGGVFKSGRRCAKSTRTRH